MLRLVSWNIGLRTEAIRALRKSNVDVALLQEVRVSPEAWEREHYDRGAGVVRLSDRVTLVPFRNIPQGRRPASDEIAVSAPGTLAAAQVVPGVGHPFVAVSVYARWEKPHPSTPTNWGVGYADAMAHRAISDLSTFIGHIDPSTHRILVAGDFNTIRGATDANRLALPARDRSVFARFEALGFVSLGPDYPAGRRAEPTPSGLPVDTANVPTYHTTRQRPATAANQLDYVFASRGFHECVSARALNEPEEWGPSDHCRIGIEVDTLR
ncbi:MAG: endonuclease/exonuclease/phosphatase family protein [Gammaproteobacteria bacterium]|nr:endonuclease/exonuclease/phosphatase family protein [Gammaproteobacteria bacterium]